MALSAGTHAEITDIKVNNPCLLFQFPLQFSSPCILLLLGLFIQEPPLSFSPSSNLPLLPLFQHSIPPAVLQSLLEFSECR